MAELTEEGMSTREAADVLGVDHATVARDAVANATPEANGSAESVAEPVANATPEPESDPEPYSERFEAELRRQAGVREVSDSSARSGSSLPRPNVNKSCRDRRRKPLRRSRRTRWSNA
jgi:hypothetical protein